MKQKQFLEVVDRDEAENRFRAALGVVSQHRIKVMLSEAHGRVLAEDVVAAGDVPAFDRSDVDGFAVRAIDTYGASEVAPCHLRLAPENLAPGIVPHFCLNPGFATAIATGAVVPRGADAVVMIEHTLVAGEFVAVKHAVPPGGNITFAGTDIGRGETVLRSGTQLSARETGVLAAIGVDTVTVFKRPQVAILSTGNEIVPPGTPLRLGQIHDCNATVLADLVRELGGEPVLLGIVPDDELALESALQSALNADLVLISGGTSKGAGDLSYKVVGRLGRPGIVVHGVALKPGKPLCLAVTERHDNHGVRRVPVAVLPGFPTSAIFTFREFLGPLVREMAGSQSDLSPPLQARLPFRINSARGRTECVLVSLSKQNDGAGWTAFPLGQGSGSITTFCRADGFITIDRNVEYLEADTWAPIQLLTPDVKAADLMAIGSHCLGLDWILSELSRRGFNVKSVAAGSTGGLLAISRGEADVAGVHLLDEATDEYNRSFVPPNAILAPGYLRMQGVVFRPGDRRFDGRSAVDAVANVVADPNCRMVNRNRGSGTRVLVDRLLGVHRPDGYFVEARSHHAVAASIAQQRSDWGVAIEPVARAAGLEFIPLQPECYDFLIPADRMNKPSVREFREILESTRFRDYLTSIGFVPRPDVAVSAAT